MRNDLNVGIYLIIPILLGILIGLKLDMVLKTKPLFVISGVVLGTISTFYNLYKLTKQTK